MKTVVLRISSLSLVFILASMFFVELAGAATPYENCISGTPPYARAGTPTSCASELGAPANTSRASAQARSQYDKCIAGDVPFDSPGTSESCSWLLDLFSETGADQPVGGGADQPTGGGSQNPGPNAGGESDISIAIENPLKGIDSPEDLLNALVKAVVIIAAPIIVLFIILSGFKYVTAQGDPTKLAEAKRALVYSIIGAVIVIGSSAILEIVANTITAFKN